MIISDTSDIIISDNWLLPRWDGIFNFDRFILVDEFITIYYPFINIFISKLCPWALLFMMLFFWNVNSIVFISLPLKRFTEVLLFMFNPKKNTRTSFVNKFAAWQHLLQNPWSLRGNPWMRSRIHCITRHCHFRLSLVPIDAIWFCWAALPFLWRYQKMDCLYKQISQI